MNFNSLDKTQEAKLDSNSQQQQENEISYNFSEDQQSLDSSSFSSYETVKSTLMHNKPFGMVINIPCSSEGIQESQFHYFWNFNEATPQQRTQLNHQQQSFQTLFQHLRIMEQFFSITQLVMYSSEFLYNYEQYVIQGDQWETQINHESFGQLQGEIESIENLSHDSHFLY